MQLRALRALPYVQVEVFLSRCAFLYKHIIACSLPSHAYIPDPWILEQISLFLIHILTTMTVWERIRVMTSEIYTSWDTGQVQSQCQTWGNTQCQHLLPADQEPSPVRWSAPGQQHRHDSLCGERVESPTLMTEWRPAPAGDTEPAPKATWEEQTSRVCKHMSCVCKVADTKLQLRPCMSENAFILHLASIRGSLPGQRI